MVRTERMEMKINHPQLGEVIGTTDESGITRFLGVKYASISNVFAPSELVTYLPPSAEKDNGIDARNLGPMVPSPLAPALKDEFSFIQHELDMPSDPPLTWSALESLHLNVYAPASLLAKREGNGGQVGKKVPVFVYVHGGGFGLGSNAWPQYDLGRIIGLSCEDGDGGNGEGKEVLGVGINYRVGLPGFLTSAELREAGYKANNGLRDQINAFLWVKENIEGFGGDPENVCFVGESAGSVSGHHLLHHPTPLFRRFISMSGNTLMMRPLPPPATEWIYTTVCSALGLSYLQGKERVDALLKVDVQRLIDVCRESGLPVLPCVDGDVIPCAPTFEQVGRKDGGKELRMEGRKWCQELMIGDCAFDGSILSHMLGPRTTNISHSFTTSIHTSLATYPGLAEKLFEAYDITLSPLSPPSSTETDPSLRNILQFATDIGFFATNLTWARGWPGTAYVYQFNEGNPWNGPWKGEAGHVLDVAYLFQNFNEFLTDEQRGVAKRFARDFLGFIRGEGPGWRGFGGEGGEGAMMYGPSGEGKCDEFVGDVFGEGSGRSRRIFDVAENVDGGLEVLAGAWGNFLSGK